MRQIVNLIRKDVKLKCAHEYRSLGLFKFKTDRVLVTLDMKKDYWDKIKHHFEEEGK